VGECGRMGSGLAITHCVIARRERPAGIFNWVGQVSVA